MFRKDASALPPFARGMAAQTGRHYWRSLDELADTPEFQDYLRHEFSAGADTWGGTSRREFLKLMGASLALAGLVGCGQQPLEKIVPYVEQPEQIIPGKPLFYATAMTMGGIATGLLVESHMGRPTKIEGNPRHPSVPATYWKGNDDLAPGVSDIFAQAAILTMYDPDRSQTVTHNDEVSTWDEFLTALRPHLDGQKDAQGAGIRLLTETVTSPTLAAQIAEFLKQFPKAKWHQFEPVNRDNELAGARLAFGEFVSPHYRVDRASVIVSLDADFLISGPDHLRHAWEFANGRDVHRDRDESGPVEMNRLYVLESTPTLTGAKADHRLPLRTAQIEQFAVALAARLGVNVTAPESGALSDTAEQWLEAVGGDLQPSQAKASLVVAGPQASPLVHALVHAINDKLGNVGKTVVYTEPVEAEPVLQYESLRELTADMNSGDVKMLCILGGNPAYGAPADVPFVEALEKVPFRFHLGTEINETAARCHWHLPEAHFLEAWSDARAADGTASIVQPLIAPLYQGKTSQEVLAMLLGQAGQPSYDLVKAHWQKNFPQPDGDEPKEFEDRWETALHTGVIPRTKLAEKTVSVQTTADWLNGASPTGTSDAASDDLLEIVFRPDPTTWDGRFANNGWLQELSKPFSKLTWDNAACVSPQLAGRLQLNNGDVVALEHEGRSVHAPIWILPGHVDRSVTLTLGYGRSHVGRVGTGTGYNAYELQTVASPWHLGGVTLRKTGERRELAVTHLHHLMQGRELVKSGTLDELQADPEHPEFMESHEPEEMTTLFPPGEHPYDGYKWGMTIDLNRCIGCNACMTACQAENNIPVVGKEQVIHGREMHWIRVDSYYEGEPANPRTVHQPVPCMQCENAPCELVCPVGATVHGDEGLNEMVYNRCVGTRYCSNNCPYKVRRFNFLQFSDIETPSLSLLYNPDVTVRNRGVMEKCTYCVQRISAARIETEKEDRTIRDGELVTACQASCPSQAIVFGDLNDPAARVTKQTSDPLNYALLGQLGTKPRTTYLAALRNPNPQLESLERNAVP